tara:strand:+ start:7532 stop:7777 length:246 start_codon:yes stop_codon:yes gene_type:complete
MKISSIEEKNTNGTSIGFIAIIANDDGSEIWRSFGNYDTAQEALNVANAKIEYSLGVQNGKARSKYCEPLKIKVSQRDVRI